LSQIIAPPESGRRACLTGLVTFYGTVTVVVFDGELSTPDESTLVT
jgi:hypothetical protein